MFGRRKNPQPPAFQSRPPVLPGMAPPAPVQSPPGPTMRSAANRLRHRARHGLWPWLALAAIPVLGAAGHATPHGYAGSAAALLAAAVAIWRLWPEMAKRPVMRWLAASWCALGAGWLAWVSLAGLGKASLLVMMGLWLPPCLAHWNLHRARHGRAQPAPPIPAPDQLLTDLRTHVCGSGGKVAGATVSELPPVDGGRRFAFDLVRGRQTTATVLGAAAEIASAAGISRDRVVTEGMPGEHPGESGPEHRAMVTILEPDHPQREVQHFTGPTLDMATGLYGTGPYPDGTMARERLFKVNAAGIPYRGASGLTCGAPESGKSVHATHRLLEQMASGIFATVALDGQRGASLYGLSEWVTWPALSPGEWPVCLRSMLRLMVDRTARIAAKKISCWDLDLGPFVGISLEEAHKILAVPSCLAAVKTLLQEGEKCGMGAVPSTQFPSQMELGGGSGPGANVLRDLAASGNVALFRTGSEFARSVLVGGTEVHPRDLPREPGWYHPLGVSMRTAKVRKTLVEESAVASWAPKFSPMPFSAGDIRAMDGDDGAYSARLGRLEEHMAAAKRGLDAGSIEEEVALILGEKAHGQPTRAQRVQKATISDHVMAVIDEHGRAKRETIIEEVRARAGDCHPSSVDQALAAFRRGGWLRQAEGRFGHWERAPLAAVKEG